MTTRTRKIKFSPPHVPAGRPHKGRGTPPLPLSRLSPLSSLGLDDAPEEEYKGGARTAEARRPKATRPPGQPGSNARRPSRRHCRGTSGVDTRGLLLGSALTHARRTDTWAPPIEGHPQPRTNVQGLPRAAVESTECVHMEGCAEGAPGGAA